MGCPIGTFPGNCISFEVVFLTYLLILLPSFLSLLSLPPFSPSLLSLLSLPPFSPSFLSLPPLPPFSPSFLSLFLFLLSLPPFSPSFLSLFLSHLHLPFLSDSSPLQILSTPPSCGETSLSRCSVLPTRSLTSPYPSSFQR